jgi:hypothetical protein
MCQQILKSKKRTFVHKSIEKTQKYLNFWAFFRHFLCNALTSSRTPQNSTPA